MKKINMGIIGMGFRGDYIAELVKKNSFLNLYSICDTNENMLKRWENTNVKIFKDYKAMIKDTKLEAVFVATPDFTHEEISSFAIDNNKHIICEKPLEIEKEKVLRLVEKVKKTNKIFMVGYVLRYSSLFIKVKELIDRGAIGDIILVQASDYISYGGYAYYHDWHKKKSGVGSLLLQKATHTLDLINWICNSQPDKVSGFGGLNAFGHKNFKNIFHKDSQHATNCRECELSSKCCESLENSYKLRGFKWSESWQDACVYGEDVEVNDNEVLIIKYKNGVKAIYTLCEFCPEYKREYVFIGNKGKLEVNDLDKKIRITYRDSREIDEITIDSNVRHGGGNEELLNDFVNCYFNKEEPVASFIEGANSVLFALTAGEAIEKEQVLKVDNLIE